ncbi:TPA: glycosyltransferase family 52, partial [Streptococcus suis]
YNSFLYDDIDDFSGLEALKIKIKSQLFGTNLSMKRIKERATKHYTVYKNKKNIIANTELIKFSDFTTPSNTSETATVLLGQPFLTQNSSFFSKIERILNGMPAYFPHPRETDLPDNCEIIQTNYLFEDYLVQNLETNFIVYTFFSTAAINVKDFPNVTVKALYTESIPDEF